MEGYRKRFVHMFPTSHTGPLVLLDGETGPADIELAARLTARFSQGRDAQQVTVEMHDREGVCQSLEVTPMPGDQIPDEWYL